MTFNQAEVVNAFSKTDNIGGASVFYTVPAGKYAQAMLIAFRIEDVDIRLAGGDISFSASDAQKPLQLLLASGDSIRTKVSFGGQISATILEFNNP